MTLHSARSGSGFSAKKFTLSKWIDSRTELIRIHNGRPLFALILAHSINLSVRLASQIINDAKPFYFFLPPHRSEINVFITFFSLCGSLSLGWTSSNVGCARLNDKCQQICEMAKGNCVNMWVECRLIYCGCVHFYVFDVGSRSQSMLHVEDTTFHLIKFGNVLEIGTLEPNQKKKKYSFILMRHFIYLLP